MRALLTIIGIILVGGLCAQDIPNIKKFSNQPLSSRERESVSLAIKDVNNMMSLINLPDTIDLSLYPTKHPVMYSYKWRMGETYVKSVPNLNALNLVWDSLYITPSDKSFYLDRITRNIFARDGYESHFYDKYNTINIYDFQSDFEATNIQGLSTLVKATPKLGDTVDVASMVGTSSQVYMSTNGDGRVDVGSAYLFSSYSGWTPNTSVDNLYGIHFTLRDNGIEQDSVGNVYVIHNDDEGIKNKTAGDYYFLYSNAGDSYLNGDLEVTGGIKQTMPTGSLTDNTPTDAEIDGILSTTPAAVGAGWEVNILDSDGSGLIYRITSDGTNWQYEAKTIAL